MLKNRQKLISANSENRTSFKGIGNNAGSGNNQLVAHIVSVSVVRFFQAVYIKYDNTKVHLFALDFLVKLRDPRLIGGGVSKSRQRIAVRQKTLLFFVFAKMHGHVFKRGTQEFYFVGIAMDDFHIIISV